MRSIAILASLACLILSTLSAQPGPTNAKRPFSIHRDAGLDDPRADDYLNSLTDPIDLTPQGKRELSGQQPTNLIVPHGNSVQSLHTQQTVAVPAQQSVIAAPTNTTVVVPNRAQQTVAVPMQRQVITPTPTNTTVVVPSTTQPVVPSGTVTTPTYPTTTVTPTVIQQQQPLVVPSVTR